MGETSLKVYKIEENPGIFLVGSVVSIMIEWEEQGQIWGSQMLRDGGYNGAVPQHLHFSLPLKF